MSFSNILHKLALSKIPLTFIFQVFCENYLLIRIAKLNMGNLIIMKKGEKIVKSQEVISGKCMKVLRTYAVEPIEPTLAKPLYYAMLKFGIHTEN